MKRQTIFVVSLVMLMCTSGWSSGPMWAWSPIPCDGATNVPINTILQWMPGACAESHDVYLSNDYYTLDDNFKGNFKTPFYNPDTLNYNTTYFWRINEVCPDEVVIGNVWQFTTEVPEPCTILLFSLSSLALLRKRQA
jgi:hypothetical protein